MTRVYISSFRNSIKSDYKLYKLIQFMHTKINIKAVQILFKYSATSQSKNYVNFVLKNNYIQLTVSAPGIPSIYPEKAKVCHPAESESLSESCSWASQHCSSKSSLSLCYSPKTTSSIPGAAWCGKVKVLAREKHILGAEKAILFD